VKVLIIGSGGREHALAWACARSGLNADIFCAPGNGGTSSISTNIKLDPRNHTSILEFINDLGIDLTIIGPEQPLVDGLADAITASGYNVFGPSAACALIEGSKSWAKTIMIEVGVPTAEYGTFKELEGVIKYLDNKSFPIVVKANGLAAGKGVLICESIDEATKAITDMFSGASFGNAGLEVIIEEFIIGREISILAMVDGEDYLILPPSRDHKRAFENETGANTGGMGAYSPVSDLSDDYINMIAKDIFPPVLRYFSDSGLNYRGCLFAGIIISESGFNVLEFNCRFGDPETQTVLPLVRFDLLDLMNCIANGSLKHWMDERGIDGTDWTKLSNGKHSTTVVAVSDGYPGDYQKGMPITNLPENSNELITFHAGTTMVDNNLTASGGRVLAVTAVSNSREDSVDMAYEAAEQIEFIGCRYRSDIGRPAE